MDTEEQAAHTHPVQIQVNDLPVTVRRHVTGLEIKEAAIAADVPIQLDFVLSLELGNRRTRIVTNDERVIVHGGESFVAVAPDDNS